MLIVNNDDRPDFEELGIWSHDRCTCQGLVTYAITLGRLGFQLDASCTKCPDLTCDMLSILSRSIDLGDNNVSDQGVVGHRWGTIASTGGSYTGLDVEIPIKKLEARGRPLHLC